MNIKLYAPILVTIHNVDELAAKYNIEEETVAWYKEQQSMRNWEEKIVTIEDFADHHIRLYDLYFIIDFSDTKLDDAPYYTIMRGDGVIDRLMRMTFEEKR